jgi:carbon-monoxide dehydrogenase small subunit
MATKINVSVNGKKHLDEVEGRLLLVHYLRDKLRLTGTHVGCDTSSCGACTVLIDGKAVKSCTMLAAQADGCSITTIEGMAENSTLHPLQEGFKEKHGLQCGFCTPGMIMTAADFLEQNPDPTDEEIRHALEGNFCRCTGYHNIVEAIKYAAEKSRGSKLKEAKTEKMDEPLFEVPS